MNLISSEEISPCNSAHGGGCFRTPTGVDDTCGGFTIALYHIVLSCSAAFDTTPPSSLDGPGRNFPLRLGLRRMPADFWLSSFMPLHLSLSPYFPLSPSLSLSLSIPRLCIFIYFPLVPCSLALSPFLSLSLSVWHCFHRRIVACNARPMRPTVRDPPACDGGMRGSQTTS